MSRQQFYRRFDGEKMVPDMDAERTPFGFTQTQPRPSTLTMGDLLATCRKVAQAHMDVKFDGMIVRDAAVFRAVTKERMNAHPAALAGVAVTESPLMADGKAALTLAGKIVSIINIGPASNARSEEVEGEDA